MAGASNLEGLLPVRPGVVDHVRSLWARIGRAGTWWMGQERVAIVREVSAARRCELCDARKEAVSPYAVERYHPAADPLPATAVDAIHRITTDPGRLTRPWYHQTVDAGMTDAQFVEMVSVVAMALAVQTLLHGIGAAPWDPPVAEAGAASRVRPEAGVELAWVPTCGPGRAHGEQAARYATMPLPAGVLQALSLVPEDHMAWLRAVAELYLPWESLVDFADTVVGRALSRVQIETLAVTVSAVNDCLYCTVAHVAALSVSAVTSQSVLDIDAVASLANDAATTVPARHLLARFARAVLGTDDGELNAVRRQLVADIDDRAAGDAACVIAAFDSLNHVASATGVEVPPRWLETAAAAAPTVMFSRFNTTG